MKMMYEQQQFCHVELNVNGKQFKARKCVLAARSEVFNAMLNN